MAVAFGSQGTYLAYGSRTNSTLVAPASIANGDLLIAYLLVVAVGNIASDRDTAVRLEPNMTGSPIFISRRWDSMSISCLLQDRGQRKRKLYFHARHRINLRDGHQIHRR